MRTPEWPGAANALQERARQAPILNRIGRINPATADPDRLTARRVRYFYTGGNGTHPNTDNYDEEYQEIIGTHTTELKKIEATRLFKALADELGPVYMGDYSPGVFLTNYLYGFNQKEGQSTGRHLLLGAMSPLSVEEYKKAVDSSFSEASLLTIDNAGVPNENSDPSYTSQMQLAGVNFIYADALQQPFSDESFDTVGSNGLFFYVRKRERLFQETLRILSPGGVYIGVEPHGKVNPMEYLRAGFSEVIQHPSLIITSRQYIDSFLRNPNMNNSELEEQLRVGKMAYELDMDLVIARKPLL